VPRRPAIHAAPPPMQATPARGISDTLDRDLSDMLDDIEPLALSPNQIIDKGNDDAVGGFSFDSILADTAVQDEPMAAAPKLVEPDDITFEPVVEEEELPAFDPPPLAVFEPAPQVAAPIPQMSVAQSAPLPDPTLSSDMADQLLEPATQAAVRSSITRLNGLGLGNSGATIESLMRDMLRPMLKEWLDEHLPAVVERVVEKEIARISRGVE
jgi:cell pole-organizing protein PopZ